MKKALLLVVLVIALICLVGCGKNTDTNPSIEAKPHQDDVRKAPTDEEILADLKQQITVVENRKDFFDNSGSLLYYIQKDYLTTTSNDPAIQAIVAKYAEQEITPMEDEVTRMYPDDVYYDTTTYGLLAVHNGILTIATQSDWWWGSPHGYPSSSYQNYVISTGEEYDFPADIKDEIYQKAEDEFMKIAEEQNYTGLLQFYFDDNNEIVYYLSYDQETDEYSLTNEQALRDYANKMIREGSFQIKDDRIVFWFDAAYSLSDWASRMLYSAVEIPNEWNI